MAILVQAAVVLAGQAASREERIQEAACRVEQIAAPPGEAEANERLAAIFRVKPAAHGH